MEKLPNDMVSEIYSYFPINKLYENLDVTDFIEVIKYFIFLKKNNIRLKIDEYLKIIEIYELKDFFFIDDKEIIYIGTLDDEDISFVKKLIIKIYKKIVIHFNYNNIKYSDYKILKKLNKNFNVKLEVLFNDFSESSYLHKIYDLENVHINSAILRNFTENDLVDFLNSNSALKIRSLNLSGFIHESILEVLKNKSTIKSLKKLTLYNDEVSFDNALSLVSSLKLDHFIFNNITFIENDSNLYTYIYYKGEIEDIEKNIADRFKNNYWQFEEFEKYAKRVDFYFEEF